MTATNVVEPTTVQAAPRRLVEDAWVTMNRRYAIGAGVLLALLVVMWALGMGPGSRPAGQAPTVTPSAAQTAPATAAPAAPAPAASVAAPTPGAGLPAAAERPAAAAGAAPSAGPATPAPLPGAPVARIYFEPDQAWPSGQLGPRLAPVLARLKAEPDTKALVSGFHDRRGSPERNAALALRRAQAVRRVLIREGVAADRIVLARPQQAQGSGPDREARRVEVTVAR
jgi:outer membrane protein OmpA-like peptidoglycan-associated protein